MSLLVRQLCQPSLDKMGLSRYHIRINTDSGQRRNMLIVGECGKTLVTINGIEFTRVNPSASEIKYAIELFEAFLVKYASEITAFTKAISTRPTDPYDQGTFTFGHRFYTGYDNDAVEYKDTVFTLTLHNNQIYVDTSEDISLKQIQNFKPDKKLLAKAKQITKELIAYREAEQIIDELRDKLNQCEV